MSTPVRKVRGRPFQRGNPGRPPGSKNKTTQIVEQLAEGQAEKLVRKVFELAEAGDVPCLKMALDRLWPVRKGQPVKVVMPPINTSDDLIPAITSIWEGLRDGHLTPEEAGNLSIVIEKNPFEAEAKALNYECSDDYCEALFKVINDSDIEAMAELSDRHNDAYRRLFAKVGLDFDNTPRNVLFDALVTMADQLPDQWLNWLRSNLRERCPDAEIAVGSTLPRRLSADNAFILAQGPVCHQNSTRKR